MSMKQSLPLSQKTKITLLALSITTFAGVLLAATSPTVKAESLLEQFPIGLGGPTTGLIQTVSGNRGGYEGEKNEGAGANGPDTAKKYFHVTKKGFNGAPKGIYAKTKYIDGGGDPQNVEFTHPDDKRRPVIVFIHGGGWHIDDDNYTDAIKYNGQPFREYIAQQGFAQFRINYRLQANGLYALRNDVMNAITHLRENADTYNIDPARIITWGDSAGGSLSVRVGATGKSGVSTSVGWSAPMNAFRDFMYRPTTALIGLDHATCMDSGFTNISTPISEIWRGQWHLFQDPKRFLELSPEELMKIAKSGLETVGVLAKSNIDVIGDLKNVIAEFGIDVDRLSNAYSVSRDSANKLKAATDKLDPEAASLEIDIDPNTNKAQSSKKSTAKGAAFKDSKNSTITTAAAHKTTTSTVTTVAVNNEELDVAFDNSELQTFKDDLTEIIEGLSASEDDSKTIRAAKQKLSQILANLPSKRGVPGKISIKEGKQQAQDVMDILTRAANSSDINDPASLIHEIGEATREDPKKAAKQPPTDEDSMRAHIAMLDDSKMNELNDALGAYRAASDRPDVDEKVEEELHDTTDAVQAVSNAISKNSQAFHAATNSDNTVGNPQRNPVAKIAECADNIIEMSPALFAHPNSPPMFLANASHEDVVPPQDAYEMRDRIRSFGTRADALILPGKLHMGYDERAVAPTLHFLRSINHPEPLNK